MSLKVFISQRAEKNLKDILEYLQSEWSVRVKDKFLKILQDKIELLSQSPLMYEASLKKKLIRRCVVTKQIVFYYKVSNDTIDIITIQDTRKNPKKLRF